MTTAADSLELLGLAGRHRKSIYATPGFDSEELMTHVESALLALICRGADGYSVIILGVAMRGPREVGPIQLRMPSGSPPDFGEWSYWVPHPVIVHYPAFSRIDLPRNIAMLPPLEAIGRLLLISDTATSATPHFYTRVAQEK